MAQTTASSAVAQPELSGIKTLRRYIFPANVKSIALKHEISAGMVDTSVQPSLTILDGPYLRNMAMAMHAPITEIVEDI